MTDWSSLRINVARLRRQPTPAELKRRAQTDATIPIEATVTVKGLEVTTGRIPEASTVTVSGNAETTLSGIEVRVRVASRWEAECRRCLTLVTEPIELDLVVSFVPERELDDEAEAYPIVGDVVDVGEVVREELMLAIPLSPLCKDDCPGPDPERFPAEATDEAGEDDEPAIDPRWAALDQLTFDD